MSLWVSVQNLPSWEVVSGLICRSDSLVSLTTAKLLAGQLGMQLDDWVKGHEGIGVSPMCMLHIGVLFNSFQTFLPVNT